MASTSGSAGAFSDAIWTWAAATSSSPSASDSRASASGACHPPGAFAAAFS